MVNTKSYTDFGHHGKFLWWQGLGLVAALTTLQQSFVPWAFPLTWVVVGPSCRLGEALSPHHGSLRCWGKGPICAWKCNSSFLMKTHWGTHYWATPLLRGNSPVSVSITHYFGTTELIFFIAPYRMRRGEKY